jgi:hypothetical protein
MTYVPRQSGKRSLRQSILHMMGWRFDPKLSKTSTLRIKTLYLEEGVEPMLGW